MNSPLPELLPGDYLFYEPTDLIGWIIAIKTWTRYASHVEVYAGSGQSYAARFSGVNLYPTRLDGLSYVLRPNRQIDMEAGRSWFYSYAIGQAYDLIPGMLCFFLAARQGSLRKMFCSEFGTRFGRAIGLHPINQDWDADKVSPGDLLKTPVLDWIYRKHR